MRYDAHQQRDPLHARVGLEALNKTLAVLPLGSLSERSFDAASAGTSIEFIDASNVPRPRLTSGVLDASWTADLEGVSGASDRWTEPLFGAAVPAIHSNPHP